MSLRECRWLRSQPMTLEMASTLCDKTAVICVMLVDVEHEHKHNFRLKAHLTPALANNCKIKKIKKQVLQGQPDLARWHKRRQGHTQRLLDGKAAGKHTTHSSEKKVREKVTMAPSTTDHRFNYNLDDKRDANVRGAATPYKYNESQAQSQRSRSMDKCSHQRASVEPTYLEDEEKEKHKAKSMKVVVPRRLKRLKKQMSWMSSCCAIYPFVFHENSRNFSSLHKAAHDK